MITYRQKLHTLRHEAEQVLITLLLKKGTMSDSAPGMLSLKIKSGMYTIEGGVILREVTVKKMIDYSRNAYDYHKMDIVTFMKLVDYLLETYK